MEAGGEDRELALLCGVSRRHALPVCPSSFLSCGTVPEESDSAGGKGYLVHGFRGFSPRSGGCFFVGEAAVKRQSLL